MAVSPNESYCEIVREDAPLNSLCDDPEKQALSGRRGCGKSQNAVIPRSEAMRNLSFCGHLNQEGSLAALGMTAFSLFSAACEAVLILRRLRHD